MEGIKVRLVDSTEEKSTQEVEQMLLDQHEAEQRAKESADVEAQARAEEEARLAAENNDGGNGNEPPAQIELKEEDVLSFIKNKYQKEVGKLEDLLVERDATADLPEDVSAFLKYKKETGRGIQDFISLNRDFESEDPKKMLLEFYKQTQPELDEEDIIFDMDERFSYDETLDDEVDIKRKKVAMKKELAKAKEHFESLKEKYKTPIERVVASIPDEEKEMYEAFKSQAQKAREQQEKQLERSQFFTQKTNELFTDEFKGFEFNIADENGTMVKTFKPSNVNALKTNDVGSFIRGFLDDQGYVKDAAAYHKAIAVAMNPDSFAKHFYEQGVADAIEKQAIEDKNITMGQRKVPETHNKSGIKVTALDSESSGRLTIKSKK